MYHRHRLDFPLERKKDAGEPEKERQSNRARALYPVDIGDCVFCQGSKVPRLYPHRCALTFNRTLIDCGIYFFSRISPVSARHHCPPPSCSHSRAHSVPLSFSLPLVSLFLSRAPHRDAAPSLLCVAHPQCRLSLSRITQARQTGLSFPFCFRFPDGCTDR